MINNQSKIINIDEFNKTLFNKYATQIHNEYTSKENCYNDLIWIIYKEYIINTNSFNKQSIEKFHIDANNTTNKYMINDINDNNDNHDNIYNSDINIIYHTIINDMK